MAISGKYKHNSTQKKRKQKIKRRHSNKKG